MFFVSIILVLSDLTRNFQKFVLKSKRHETFFSEHRKANFFKETNLCNVVKVLLFFKFLKAIQHRQNFQTLTQNHFSPFKFYA